LGSGRQYEQSKETKIKRCAVGESRLPSQVRGTLFKKLKKQEGKKEGKNAEVSPWKGRISQKFWNQEAGRVNSKDIYLRA